MKQIIISFTLCLSLTLSLSLFAQEENPLKHHLGAKVLAIDYGRANGISDLDITYGLEGLYIYRFFDYASLGLAGKTGVVNVFDDINNRRFASADAVLQFHLAYNDSSLLVPFVFAGGSLSWETELGSHPQIPLGGGAMLRVGKNAYIIGHAEYRHAFETNRSNVQVGIGGLFRLGAGKPDTDQDGVPDHLDDCPEIPGYIELKGCPDTDKDGISDRYDECPDLPGKDFLKGCPDADGDGFADKYDDCPDVQGTVGGCPDIDGDGIVDKSDKCPDVAGVESLEGCPDRDGDGIADSEDKCPEEAGTLRNGGCPVLDSDDDGLDDENDMCPNEPGTLATRGCPDADMDGVADKDDRCPDIPGPYAGCPDSDGDGVVDADDRCPEEVGPATNKGCPEIEEEVREVLNFAMRNVQFQTGRATLKPESFNILDQLVAIMNQYPAYNLRIAGHTDNKGDENTNLILSEERAKACYAFLVSKGVSPIRLSYLGYGELRPIADNNSIQGRTMNRRVEFEMYLK